MNNDNLKEVKTYLSDEQIITFLREINENHNDIFAVELVNEELNNTPLSNVFLSDKNEDGYFLEIKKISNNKFRISFGCHAGDLAGDGGVWNIDFLNGNCKMNLVSEWIS